MAIKWQLLTNHLWEVCVAAEDNKLWNIQVLKMVLQSLRILLLKCVEVQMGHEWPQAIKMWMDITDHIPNSSISEIKYENNFLSCVVLIVRVQEVGNNLPALFH